ncbi:uncharacterized protein LOC111128643 [Crassostrea virginica]
MDQWSTAQDLIRCDLCKKNIVEMHCDTCLVSLCKPCVGEHMSDESKDHKVVKFMSRNSNPIYPYCSVHPKERCELHCQPCYKPICSACIASEEHKSHKVTKILQIWESKKQDIEKDNSELQSKIAPLYQKMLDRISERISEIEENAEETDKSITRHSEGWHEEVNKIVKVLKSQNQTRKEININSLKAHSLEMNDALSKIKEVVDLNEDLLFSSNLEKAFSYTSQTAACRKGPVGVYAPVSKFQPVQIQQEKIVELFGSLSIVSPLSSYLCPDTGELLMKAPQCVDTIINDVDRILDIAPFHTDQIVALFVRNIRIFSTRKKGEIKSIALRERLQRGFYARTMRELIGGFDRPSSISVSKDGDLVYCTSLSNSVNVVKNDIDEYLINLDDWRPRGVCCTLSGDMLVSMTHNRNPPKVVRYNGTTEKQIIQFDDKTNPLFSFDENLYIIENQNRDICVSCEENVVVVSEIGKRRFRYPSERMQPFSPKGLATDCYCHILIADKEGDRVHIIDQGGKFLRYIDCSIRRPWGLCIDAESFLFVANQYGESILKIKYLQ